jgi:hypothetical protein
MMIVTAIDWRKLLLTKSELLRMLSAGTAWGIAVSAGIEGMTFWNYNMICSDDVAITTAVSIAAGILAIGPIAAYGGRR